MKLYWLKPAEPSRLKGEYIATRRWSLPGIHCPACDATWSSASDAYPCVDLSGLEEHEKFSSRLEKDYAEFERLRALVQPLVPAGVRLRPGTKFGPLVGTARGNFGHFVSVPPPERIRASA